MDPVPLTALVSTALGGALVGAAACYWPLKRSLVELQGRLERSEQARNGALERSVQAREQISQLNRAISDLRRTHSHSRAAAPALSPKELAEQALAAGDEKTLVMPRREAIEAFADTQIDSR